MNGLSHFETFRSKATSQTMEVVMISLTPAEQVLNAMMMLLASVESREFELDYARYIRVNSQTEQVRRLRIYFPELKRATFVERDFNCPEGSDGLFVYPNIWRKESVLAGTYNSIVKKALRYRKVDHLRVTDKWVPSHRGFTMTGRGSLDDDLLGFSQRQSVVSIMRKVSEDQGDPDFLVLPAQFGNLHRLTDRQTIESEMPDQVLLGVFAVCIMIATHQEIFNGDHEMPIVAGGDDSLIRYAKPGNTFEECVATTLFHFNSNPNDNGEIGMLFNPAFSGDGGRFFGIATAFIKI